MRNNQFPAWLVPALLVVGGWFLFKFAKQKGAGGVVIDDCQSSDSDNECRAVGVKLRSIFDDIWVYTSDSDEAKIIAQLRNISDSCGLRKVVSVFGTLSTWRAGKVGTMEGDLEYWLQTLSDDAKEQIRGFIPTGVITL